MIFCDFKGGVRKKISDLPLVHDDLVFIGGFSIDERRDFLKKKVAILIWSATCFNNADLFGTNFVLPLSPQNLHMDKNCVKRQCKS